MADNVFEGLILEGRLRNEPELRKCYRSLAAKLHPDARGEGASAESFLRLRRDFEEARAMLEARGGALAETGPSLGPSRAELYAVFEELAATGFPLDLSIRGSSKAYLARIKRFTTLLKAYGALPGSSFREVEREMYEIRGENIVDNPLFGKIRLILYNLVSWHWEPRAFTKSALLKWMGEIRPELEARRLPAVLAFLSWLVEDLKNGPAL